MHKYSDLDYTWGTSLVSDDQSFWNLHTYILKPTDHNIKCGSKLRLTKYIRVIMIKRAVSVHTYICLFVKSIITCWKGSTYFIYRIKLVNAWVRQGDRVLEWSKLELMCSQQKWVGTGSFAALIISTVSARPSCCACAHWIGRDARCRLVISLVP